MFVISVKVDQNGRIVLPKKTLKKYGISEGSRLIITESKGRIYLTPEKTCEKPNEAMFGSIKVAKPIETPRVWHATSSERNFQTTCCNVFCGHQHLHLCFNSPPRFWADSKTDTGTYRRR